MPSGTYRLSGYRTTRCARPVLAVRVRDRHGKPAVTQPGAYTFTEAEVRAAFSQQTQPA